MHNDFFEVLKKDHREVMDILEQIKKAGDGSEKKREELFAKLKQEITAHMRAEEHAFYAALQGEKETRENILESMEEHHVTELVLKELDKMSKKEERWSAKLSVFKELVEHHVEEEEEKIFKDANKVLSHDQMEGILKRFQTEKQKILSSTR